MKIYQAIRKLQKDAKRKQEPAPAIRYVVKHSVKAPEDTPTLGRTDLTPKQRQHRKARRKVAKASRRRNRYA